MLGRHRQPARRGRAPRLPAGRPGRRAPRPCWRPAPPACRICARSRQRCGRRAAGPALASTMKKMRSASPIAISVWARMRPCKRVGRRILEAGGVDDVEIEIVEPGRMHAPVARDARRVVDQRQLAAGEPVEKRRLADVGPADDGDLEAHRRVTTRRPNRGSVRPAGLARSRVLRGAPSSEAICSNSFSASAARPFLPGREAERLARRVAQRVGVGGQRLGAGRDVGIRAVVDQQKAARSLAMSRIATGMEVSAGNGVEAGDGAGEIALGGKHGRGAHAGEDRIGAVAIRFQRLQRAERLVVLALVGELAAPARKRRPSGWRASRPSNCSRRTRPSRARRARRRRARSGRSGPTAPSPGPCAFPR